MNVAMLLSCGSFEGFFGRVQGQTRESYLLNYRNDWAWYYAKGLLENNIKVTIYIPSLYENGKFETEDGISVRFLKLKSWYRPLDKTIIKQISRQTKLSLYVEERLNTIAFMKEFRRGLEKDNIILIYIQEYWSGRFDHIVHRVTLPVLGANMGGVAEACLKWFKRDALRKAALCYGQTEEECRKIVKFGGSSKFQPNGLDVTEFYPSPEIMRNKTILSVARLTNKQKRTSDIIRAIALLPDEWTLDIVGTGPDKRMLEDLAVELGVASRVTFHGFVGRSEVRNFLRRCGVYAMPSDNEGVAFAALEAMGCGAAVVLSRIPAFEQLIDDGINGALVSVGEVKALASAFLSAWEHREAWGRAAAETVKTRYNTQILYQQLAESMRMTVKLNKSKHPLT